MIEKLYTKNSLSEVHKNLSQAYAKVQNLSTQPSQKGGNREQARMNFEIDYSK